MTALSTVFAVLLAGVALSIVFEMVATWQRLRQPLRSESSSLRVQQRLAVIASEDRRSQSLPFVGVDRRRTSTEEEVRRQA